MENTLQESKLIMEEYAQVKEQTEHVHCLERKAAHKGYICLGLGAVGSLMLGGPGYIPLLGCCVLLYSFAGLRSSFRAFTWTAAETDRLSFQAREIDVKLISPSNTNKGSLPKLEM